MAQARPPLAPPAVPEEVCDLVEQVRELVGGLAVVLVDDLDGTAALVAGDPSVHDPVLGEALAAQAERLAHGDLAPGDVVTVAPPRAGAPLRLLGTRLATATGDEPALLGLACWSEEADHAGTGQPTDPGVEPTAHRGLQVLRQVLERCGAPDAATEERRGLDELVSAVARRLMPVRSAEADSAIAGTLALLHTFLGCDSVFLRRNDPVRGVSVLVDEWPRRATDPEDDPLSEVPLHRGSSWGALRDLRAPLVQRAAAKEAAEGLPVFAGRGVSLVVVPLRGQDTEGVLGVLQRGDRAWSSEEVSALEAIAVLLQQLSTRLSTEERLAHAAHHDDLTGLPNRDALLDELERRRAEAPGSPFALVLLDVDGLGEVNDLLGQDAGDALLTTVADRVRTSLRDQDLVGRVSSDELLVLVGDAAGDLEGTAVAERLLRQVREPVTLGGEPVRRTASAGVTVARDDEASAEELLARATTALHEAKQRGRGQIAVFDERARSDQAARFHTEMQLRRALDERQLTLHYQPEVDLRTGRLLAVEALLRWHHPERGLLPASAFIETAERTGMVVELGHWVLDEALAQVRAWREQHALPGLVVRINISPQQLHDRVLLTRLAQALRAREEPSPLSLEITEHAVMADVETAAGLLTEARALGASVALDDFGVGSSSLAQLKRLPLDHLKIDRSFVAGLSHDAADHSVIASIAQLAKAFSLSVIAEGVERHDQRRRLLQLGCRRAQGFLLARPSAPADLAPILARGGVALGEGPSRAAAEVTQHDAQALPPDAASASSG